MHKYLVDMLICPSCHGKLKWDISEQDDRRILEAEAHCSKCDITYPIHEGIGIFLTGDLDRNDLWEQVDERFAAHFKENPETETKLMDSPLDSLSAADRFFRSRVLEERGQFVEARPIAEAAFNELYTDDYLEATNSQIDYVVQQVDGPVVDLASGLGYLVKALLEAGKKQVVATDFSPTVLKRSKRYYETFGLYDELSLLACDARQMPFADGAVPILTTNLGLANIEHPGDVLIELRRIVSKHFLAISMLYPDNDDENARILRQFGLDTMMFEALVLQQFTDAGWQVEVANRYEAQIQPTPKSDILNMGIDGLPVVDTEITICTLQAI